MPETLESFESPAESVEVPVASTSTMSALPSPDLNQYQEFNYRPVPILAPVTFTLGILASIGLMGIVGLAFGVFGIIVGIVALLKIRRAQGELGGRVVTWVGVVLSALFLVGGSTLHAYTFATEIPEGYQRVNFFRDISKKGFLFSRGKSDFHPEVKALDQQPIFVKGYMYPTKQTENLGSFLLVKDSGDCCFGGQPAVTDMIVVNMQGGKTVNYKEGLISVAGTFHCQPTRGLAEVSENPVYVIDGTLVERARTQF